MIRCVQIWTGDAGHSLFEEGQIDLGHGERANILSDTALATSISYCETQPGGTYAPHQAPIR